jgi:glycosyltransferase involved in cell wall biosynthesis
VPVAITPISDGYKRRIVKKYGVGAEKVHVVEVGVDSVESLVSDGKEKSQFVVMYSGVLGVGYDFETVLKAAGSLSKYEDIVFLIRGIGELAPKLEQLIGELNLGNVVLDTNFLPKAKLSALLRSADAFLLPMSSASFVDEGLPTKVFEYQAYGKPIICISGGQPGRYVSETESGIVVKPGDCEALAETVLYLRENHNVAEKLGECGRRYVENNLSIEKIGLKMMMVFKKVLANSSVIHKAEQNVA